MLVESPPHAERPQTILVVDDDLGTRTLLSGLLQSRYRVQLASNGAEALQSAQGDDPPDLVLLEIRLPGLSGWEVCQMLKDKPTTRSIPVIFLTATPDLPDEIRGIEMGAADFITKPINPPIVFARVGVQLQLKAMADFLKDQNSYLEAEVERRGRVLTAIQDVTKLAVASLAEARDSDTGNHKHRS